MKYIFSVCKKTEHITLSRNVHTARHNISLNHNVPLTQLARRKPTPDVTFTEA